MEAAGLRLMISSIASGSSIATAARQSYWLISAMGDRRLDHIHPTFSLDSTKDRSRIGDAPCRAESGQPTKQPMNIVSRAAAEIVARPNALYG